MRERSQHVVDRTQSYSERHGFSMNDVSMKSLFISSSRTIEGVCVKAKYRVQFNQDREDKSRFFMANLCVGTTKIDTGSVHRPGEVISFEGLVPLDKVKCTLPVTLELLDPTNQDRLTKKVHTLHFAKTDSNTSDSSVSLSPPTQTPESFNTPSIGPIRSAPSMAQACQAIIPTPSSSATNTPLPVDCITVLLFRSSQASPWIEAGNLTSYTLPRPSLDVFFAPGSRVTDSWSYEEIKQRRRIYKTSVDIVETLICVTFTAVQPEDYREGMPCISVLKPHKDVSRYLITSVDMIRLLKYITCDWLPVSEQNRIRRNLEKLKPKTVSNHGTDEEVAIYRLICSLSHPEPKNISKDIKVFEWDSMARGLRKVLSRYIMIPIFDDKDLPIPPPGHYHRYSYPHEEIGCKEYTKSLPLSLVTRLQDAPKSRTAAPSLPGSLYQIPGNWSDVNTDEAPLPQAGSSTGPGTLTYPSNQYPLSRPVSSNSYGFSSPTMSASSYSKLEFGPTDLYPSVLSTPCHLPSFSVMPSGSKLDPDLIPRYGLGPGGSFAYLDKESHEDVCSELDELFNIPLTSRETDSSYLHPDLVEYSSPRQRIEASAYPYSSESARLGTGGEGLNIGDYLFEDLFLHESLKLGTGGEGLNIGGYLFEDPFLRESRYMA